MILYKALCDLESFDVQIDCCFFQTNDVIKFLKQTTKLWFKGKNLMTKQMGSFPISCMLKLNIPEVEDNLFILKESFQSGLRGDVLIGSEVRENDVVGYIWMNCKMTLSAYPLKHLICVKEMSANLNLTDDANDSESIEGIRFREDNEEPQETFVLDGTSEGKEGINNSKTKYTWVALFDYKSENINHLTFASGDRLRFVDRIGDYWMIMEDESGCVGIAPGNYVKNAFSIDTIENEIKKEEKEEENFSSILSSNYDDIDENIYEEDNSFEEEKSVLALGRLLEPLFSSFEEREKRVLNDMEIILDDIKRTKSKISLRSSDDHYIQVMNCNLSFLKEEFKEKERQLAFVKQQKEIFLRGSPYDAYDANDANCYISIKTDEQDDKMYFTRNKIIEEILKTEKKYLSDLKLTLKVFNNPEILNKMSKRDYNSLFGDVEVIVSVSENFYKSLEESINKSGTDVLIGSIFLDFLEPFESAYKQYCVNYERKFVIFSKKSGNMEDVLREGLRMINESGTIISSIDSMLVKPLQRFLKYPLFIRSLINNTNEGHFDISNLRIALVEFENTAKKINDKKRFEDLRTEIFEHSSQWHQKTFHALKKMPKRLLVTSFYKSQFDEDLDYQMAVENFKKLKKSLSFFIATIVILRDNLKDFVFTFSCLNEDLNRIFECKFGSPLFQYLDLCKAAEEDYRNKYVIGLEANVVTPITRLLQLFSGPRVLIKKRESKFLDYIGMRQRFEDKETTRSQSEKIEDLKNQYIIINDTLKEELLILDEKASTVFYECLGNYLYLTTNIMKKTMEGLQSLIMDIEGQSADCQMLSQNIQTELLNKIKRNLISNTCFDEIPSLELSLNSPGFYRHGSVGRNSNYCQTDEDVASIKMKYQPNDLAYVKKNFIPTKPHQINVAIGNVVGINKRCDPQGNTSSWLVEVHPKRLGFVPRSYLDPFRFPQDTVARDSVDPTLSKASPKIDMTEFSANSHASRTRNPPDRPPLYNVRSALYDFKSMSSSKMVIKKNDQLQLIMNHDKNNNTDWSLVKNLSTGEQGYVPSNYISHFSPL